MLRVWVIAIAALCASTAYAFELPRQAGMYQASGQPLPMVDSSIAVTVRGPLVEVIVTQRFTNRTDHATEATYIFPLPADAAVSAMWIRTGAKTIRAKIAPREEAQQRYEEAVRAGVVAAVLDQERTDIFTQTVAGIAPKSTVEVTLRYDALAHFYDGAWALALPMVVAPRYVAGTATARPTTGTGRAPDTDRAPDASRVTPAGAPGAGGATTVTITFVDKAWEITSPTHELAVVGTKASFTDPRSDHDALLRWKAPNVAGWVEQSSGGAFAAVVVQAPAPAQTNPPAGTAHVRCLLVLDRSASSRGDADAIARPFVRQLLANLEAADRVAVTGSDALAWSAPQVVQRALDQTWTHPPGAFDLTRVLQQARPDGAPIVLVTGGLVADDRAAIAAAKKLGVPVHVIGVGPAPARGLLMQLATTTAGTARFAMPGDDLVALARSVIADLGSPPTPLTVNWGALAARDVVPGTLPRLGAGQAVLVLARVAKAQTANVRAGGELFAIEALPPSRTVEGATSAVGPLGRRWARSRLEELLAAVPDPKTVTALALQYGLVSPYTSMVAIGEEVVVQGGTRRSVAVPVSVPAGMRWQAVKRETAVDTSEVNDRAVGRHPADAKRTEKKVTSAPTVDAGSDDRATERGDELAAPTLVFGSVTNDSYELTGMSGIAGRRLRVSASIAGGLLHEARASTSVLAVGARVELRRPHFLVGIDGTLLVVGGDDIQGRAMLALGRGVARHLELGVTAGAQLGGGIGPAGSLRLAYRLPPAPSAATFLRYDAAYLFEDDESRGQQQLTLGLEWGF